MSYHRFIGHIENNTVILEDEEFHHAKVRRIKEEYKIEINDLQGNIYLAEVYELSKNYLKAKILEKLIVEEEKLKIYLYLCMPNKLSKVDDIIEPISELGTYSLIPVLSKNSAIKEKEILKKIPKWEKIARNSIKQCKRVYPLKIEKPLKLKDIKAKQNLKFVFYEKEKEKTLKDFLKETPLSVAVIIGSEGGFTEEEIKTLKEKSFFPVSLGKNILKMETAVLSGICQIRFAFS